MNGKIPFDTHLAGMLGSILHVPKFIVNVRGSFHTKAVQKYCHNFIMPIPLAFLHGFLEFLGQKWKQSKTNVSTCK